MGGHRIHFIVVGEESMDKTLVMLLNHLLRLHLLLLHKKVLVVELQLLFLPWVS